MFYKQGVFIAMTPDCVDSNIYLNYASRCGGVTVAARTKASTWIPWPRGPGIESRQRKIYIKNETGPNTNTKKQYQCNITDNNTKVKITMCTWKIKISKKIKNRPTFLKKNKCSTL